MNNFISSYSWLIPVLPFIGFLLNGVPTAMGIRLPKKYVHVVACGVMFLSFVMSVLVFFFLKGQSPETREFTRVLWPWIHIGFLNVDVAFLFDALSIVMALVITGVGFLIHLYSVGYMDHDPSYSRFFTYLNLFCFMMLVLVLGDNLLLLFVGWEGVGLCSYLLIGFWIKDKANGAAGMKAFVVNRIGDFGMMLGLILLFWSLQSLGFPSLKFVQMKFFGEALTQLSLFGVSAVTLICILLFVGATGKSAQLPLFVWLPDAMAGPTPVSALIHAATMVTAGVYMIARLNWLFVLSPVALIVIATIGALTAFIGATIGFAQNDIKKVLAYSTVSQLGFMMLAMGAGAFSAGVFHLMTHAFFKACLFLGAGSVIMAMHHEQDMRKMGGLKKYMPITFMTFLAATFAICGIVPFCGFFSKDEILWQTFSRGGFAGWYYFLWAMGFVAAMGTAFYMVRLVVMTFFGEHKTQDSHHTPEESPWTVTLPLVVLGFLSVVAGFLNIPYVINNLFGGHSNGLFNSWLGSVIPEATHHSVHAIEWVLMFLSVLVAACGMYFAFVVYTRRLDIRDRFIKMFSKVYDVVYNKYFIDEFYHDVFVKGLLKLNVMCAVFDRVVIDGLVNLIGRFTALYALIIGWWDDFFVDGIVNRMADVTLFLGDKLKRVQTGHIQHYAFGALLSVVVIMLIKLLI